MDEHGYPTEETLKTIADWSHREGYKDLMEYIKSKWYHADHCWDQEGNTYYISTAGWSGNEEMIHAMRENFMFWSICWESSRRGGHYVFIVEK